ncbi:uncharacterized protein TNCV_1039371 [Trichonephila clavipes]|uniref:Uncharacterized protein n=1 Tax=Trichonephila clavipes TaxID=2585209 RepID=A0A8X6VWA5_TRICX|nr:uncharacterized protein TNCV_1039371 [Trichonephila clavipes]
MAVDALLSGSRIRGRCTMSSSPMVTVVMSCRGTDALLSFRDSKLPRFCTVEVTRFQYNAFPDKNSRTTVTVSLPDVTGIKAGPDLSSNQNALRIASGAEKTLIRKEDSTRLISCTVFVLSAPL